MRRTVVPITALVLGLLLPGSAHAKDLRQRVGVGFSNQFGHLSSLSVKVGMPTSNPAVNIQAQLVGGYSVLNNTSPAWFVGARGLYGFVAEDNMNLYLAGGVGFKADGVDNALRLQPALGAEFFLFGLENLGLSAECGVDLDLLGPGVDTYTFGGAAGVGAHYYF